ncbi:MAG: hypothetical protein GX072_03255 [Lysinibacillus sp.]|nr:hypothetical protein [Lysinibacillus sp.]
MKKIIFPLIFIVLILSACSIISSSSTYILGIEKLNKVPNKVQERIDFNADAKLQILETGGSVSYIVYFSNGDVTAYIEKEEDKLIIHLEETNQQGEALEQHVFKLTKDHPDIEYMEVQINGKPTPFDVSSSV